MLRRCSARLDSLKGEDVGDILAKGFTCVCGEYHAYSVYVYAHWDFSLSFICPKCNRKYVIMRGIAMENKKAEP
jgi:hypothetical protein